MYPTCEEKYFFARAVLPMLNKPGQIEFSHPNLIRCPQQLISRSSGFINETTFKN